MPLSVSKSAIVVIVTLLGGCSSSAGGEGEPTPRAFCPTLEWNTGDAGVRWAKVVFDDLVPQSVSLEQSWNGMGQDAEGRVYIGFTSMLDDGREDFFVFRYDPFTCERELLGSFIQISEAAGNYVQGESIPKGHTRFIEANGTLYLGSQSFHDFKWEIDGLTEYRGSHLYAFDVSSGAWSDLSAPLPGGVVTEHQGILGLDILRDQGLLVGVTHPHNDLVFYDYESRELVDVVAGIPWTLGNPLSRELVAVPSGHIYTYRGTEDPSQRDESHPMYVYDMSAATLTETDFMVTEGFWIGKTETRDGSTVYVSTSNGRLYSLEVGTETWSDLGPLLPVEQYEAGRRVNYHYTLTLSPDEGFIYFMSTQIVNPAGSGELYRYEIASGAVELVQQQVTGVYTSGDVRDEKHLYFAHFGTAADPWSGNAGLFILEVPEPTTDSP